MAKRQCQGVIVRLFTELKRRNVLRMAALYIAAAWLCVEVAGALIDLSVLPGTMGPWVVVLLAVGFPIALVVSWFFDVTPEGVVRETNMPEGQPVLAAGGRRTDFIIIAMLAAAVILLLVWEPPASGDEGLTVLPFESLTGPDEAGFSEGMSIELQSLLSRLRKFKVKKPPEASIRAGISDIPTLARELGVRWVLQGSVRRAKNRVRIAVELIDADDDAAIAWSNVFDRELRAEDLFNIQAEIARSITNELRYTLDEPAEKRLAAPPTQNTEAYEAYLLGRQRLTDLRVDSTEDAIARFAKAVDLDPNFGRAYSGLADACLMRQDLQQVALCPDSTAGLVALARKAVQLDPESGEGWISLGATLAISIDRSTFLNEHETFEKVTAEADAAFQRGLALQPGYPRGYSWYGYFLRRKVFLDGTFEEAFRNLVWVKVWQQGLEVDPLSFDLHVAVSMDSPPELSLRHAQRAAEIAPDSPLGFWRLGEVFWFEHGRVDESIKFTSKAVQLDPRNINAPWHLGLAYSALGDFEMAGAYFRLLRINSADTSHDINPHEAITLLYEGRKAEAVRIFEEVLLKDLGAFHPLWILASIEVSSGQADKALERFRRHLPQCFDGPKSLEFRRDCPGSIFLRVLQAVGDERAAQEVVAAITAESESSRDQSGSLESARYYAMLGRHDEALSALENYVEKGLRGYRWLRNDWRFFAYYDITLDAIRDHPRFRAAIAVIEADMAQQLENVREMERRGEVPTLEEVNAMIASAGQESGSDGE